MSDPSPTAVQMDAVRDILAVLQSHGWSYADMWALFERDLPPGSPVFTAIEGWIGANPRREDLDAAL